MNTNQMTGKFAWRFIAAFATVLVWAASAAAQTVVVETGNPDIDVVITENSIRVSTLLMCSGMDHLRCKEFEVF